MARKGTSVKRKGSEFLKHISASNSLPWIEEFTPRKVEDLAVHKKKVSEVQTWLQKYLGGSKKGAPILLLTGPPGVGKTATIMALCYDMNTEVQVWSNTRQDKSWSLNEGNVFAVRDGMSESENQTTAFSRFLLHSTKYSLVSTNCKVILVEEVPNALVRNPGEFQSIVRKYCSVGRYPLVFVISDNTKGESSENHLFPKDLQLSLKIYNIGFNPVAPTMMMKVLTRINMSSKVDSTYQRLIKSELEIIAADSKGDIRNAINTMQFLCITKSAKSNPPLKKKGQEPKVEKSSDCVLKRDSSLFLFHALGKVLYCKREPWLKSEADDLPKHLKHLERAPLVENAEDVFGKTSISPDGFNLFLQENYLSFIEDIKIASECSKWLSEADYLSSFWSTRETMNDYSVSLAIRGLMFNLVPTTSGRHWKSLHKPQYYESNSKKNSLTYSLKQNFKGTNLSMRELQTDFIPFLPKLNPKSFSLAHTSFAKEVGVMSIKRAPRIAFRSTLDEKACFDAEAYSEDFEVTKASGPDNVKDFDAEINISDEEIVIEEYDF